MIMLLIVLVFCYYMVKTKSPIETKPLRFILLESRISVISSNNKNVYITSLLISLYRRESVTF